MNTQDFSDDESVMGLSPILLPTLPAMNTDAVVKQYFDYQNLFFDDKFCTALYMCQVDQNRKPGEIARGYKRYHKIDRIFEFPHPGMLRVHFEANSGSEYNIDVVLANEIDSRNYVRLLYSANELSEDMRADNVVIMYNRLNMQSGVFGEDVEQTVLRMFRCNEVNMLTVREVQERVGSIDAAPVLPEKTGQKTKHAAPRRRR